MPNLQRDDFWNNDKDSPHSLFTNHWHRIRETTQLHINDIPSDGDTKLGNILSLTILGFNRSMILLRFSNRLILTPRSCDPNIRTMTGWISFSNSSSDNFSAIDKIIPKTLFPPPPNSNAFNISGRILKCRNPGGYFCNEESNCLHDISICSGGAGSGSAPGGRYWKKRSRSWSPCMDMFSSDSEHLIRSVVKNDPVRRPNSKNWETVSRSLGEGLRRRL